jgi:rhamnosyltransferase
LERVFPFVVQNNGYYTGWVMSDNWARIQIDNWNYLLHGLINISAEKTGWSPFLEQVSRIRNE